MLLSAAITLTEERSFTAQLGDHRITGLTIASAWEGMTKYLSPNGAHLIVLAEEKRIVSASPELIAHLAGAPEQPVIGASFAGGIYAGLTEIDGAPARLVLIEGEAASINWADAGKWATEQGGTLPTRKELITLYENLKSEFAEVWYWSGQQHVAYADSAWGQYFGYGGQGIGRKSSTGRARAVRRLPI